MTKEEVIQQSSSFFPFEVVAVHNNASHTQQNTTSSLPPPVNVKIKIRNKDEILKGKHGLISVPKFNANSWPKKVRLVSSDQTIMSFNLIMEPNKDERGRKSHRGLLQMFRPGGCLSVHNDEDEYTYMPSTSNELNRKGSIGQQDFNSKAKNETFSLKKNVFSPSYTNTCKTPKPFLGKCKPGGCLDPPFGEDKYIYKPTFKDNQLSKHTLQTNDINKMLLDSDQNTVEVGPKKQTPDQETNVLHQSYIEPAEHIEDSERLVTYPLPVSSSYVKSRDSQSRKPKSRIQSEQLESSPRLTSELPVSFFMPPRKERPKQRKSYDDYNDKENKVKEAYINNEYAMQSQTPSEILSDALTSPSYEEPLQNVDKKEDSAVKPVHPSKAQDLVLMSDLEDIKKEKNILLQEQTATDPSVIENQGIVSKITVSDFDALTHYDQSDIVQKMEVKNIVSEDKNIKPEVKDRSSSSDLKLSSERLPKTSLPEVNFDFKNLEKDSLSHEFAKRKTGLRNGINNILDPIQKEVLKKESMKSLQDSRTDVVNHDSKKVSETNVKLSQDEITKPSIDQLNSLLNYSQNEGIAESDIRRENILRNGTNGNLDSTQQEVFEKDPLKYEATITDDNSIQVDKSNLEINLDDKIKTKIDQLRERFSNQGEIESIADTNVKIETLARNKMDNILDPVKEQIYEKGSLSYQKSRTSISSNISKNVSNEVDINNLKNLVTLQNQSLDNNDNPEVNLKKQVEHEIESITPSVENGVFQNKISVNENIDKQFKRPNEIDDIESKYSKKSLSPKISLKDTESPKTVDLNLEKLSAKGSKSESGMKLSISSDEQIKIRLESKSLTLRDLPTNNIVSETSFKSYDEIQDMDNDKNVSQNNSALKQEMKQSLSELSKASKLSFHEKLNYSPQILKSEVLQDDVFQDKNTLNNSSYEFTDSNILRTDQYSNNTESKSEINVDINKEAVNLKENILLHKDLNNKLEEWTPNGEKSVQSIKIADNLVLDENINMNRTLSHNMDDNYVTNNVNEDDLNTFENQDFSRDLTQIDKDQAEKTDHELASLKSGDKVQVINKISPKAVIDGSSIDDEKIITSGSSVAINFVFQTVRNEFGFNIKTLDPTANLAAYPQNEITTVRASLKDNDNEIKIKMDTETDMIILIKRNSKRDKGSKRVESYERKELIRGYCSETIINRDKLLRKTLKTVYDTLVPIEKIIANLKEEADALYREQILLKKILSSREMKSKRIIRTNETCSCLEKELGIN